jgi:plasmid stabilization system protein ParE
MVKLPIEYHPAARLEAFDAFNWYLERSHLAAERFQEQLETAQRAIQDDPETWPVYLGNTRHYRLKRYPYIVVYRIRKDLVEVLAVAHARREPGYWVDRLWPFP